MANEFYKAALGDLLATNVYSFTLRRLLRQKPFMRGIARYDGDIRGSGSGTKKQSQIDQDDVATAVAEGAGPSNTALTSASYTLSPARQAIQRTLSDLAELIDATGLLNPFALAIYNFTAVMKAFDALFCAAFPSLTGTVGTTTINFTADDWFSMKQTSITRNWSGRKIFVGYPQQFADLQDDLRGEVGPWQLDLQVQAAVRSSRGESFKGMLDDVEIWTSDQVPTANGGADSNGAFLSFDDTFDPELGVQGGAAIAYAEGTPSPAALGRERITAPGSPVYTDVGGGTDANLGESTIVTGYFVAAGVAEAGRGISVVTDR